MVPSQPWLMTQMAHPRYARITRAEERKLFAAHRAGDPKAEEKILNANARFVIRVAMKYMNRGLELEDLISEGLLGMKRAFLRFDENTGFKFISYAVWWIRQGMMSALAEQSNCITLPVNMLNEFMKVTRALNRSLVKLERLPTQEELAEEANVKPQVVEDYYQYCVSKPLNIDYKNPESEDEEFVLPDNGPLPDADQEAKRAAAYRNALFVGMKPIERDVLLRYHGLTNRGEQNLDEIGQAYGLTRERIRQIKDRALDRARSRARLLKLDARMEDAARNAMRRAGPISIGQARRA